MKGKLTDLEEINHVTTNVCDRRREQCALIVQSPPALLLP